ncbi:hypothetical protein M408DRAFT_25109 [Serendipita vermifera MAFF 305830]|uniref:Uncharacterized protein n=1 Tax=Serendipita vermifera MAFF 305830 TaxID=933852 RepID=A0A0C2WKI5_SERVB|nr:hypothetical protein M408DRAFT_25109 [Serendipita vermifera MAFF 305830]
MTSQIEDVTRQATQNAIDTTAWFKNYIVWCAIFSGIITISVITCVFRVVYNRTVNSRNVSAGGRVVAPAANQPKTDNIQLPFPVAPVYHRDTMYKGSTESLALTRMPSSTKWPASPSRPSSELDPHSPHPPEDAYTTYLPVEPYIPYPPVEPFIPYPPVGPNSPYLYPPGLKPHYNAPVASSHAY